MYNFDEIIDRHGTRCLNVDTLEETFGRPDLVSLWVADMDFRTPDFITGTLRRRLDHPILGYPSTGEDYFRIQDAINAVPYGTEAEIIVSDGVYHEKLFSDKKDLSIRGEGRVCIINSDSALETMERGRKRGTFRTYTAFFSGERLHLENITIVNGSGSGKMVAWK